MAVSAGASQSSPATLVFTPSVNDPTTVDYYTVEIYLAGGAMPVASRYLGRPSALNGEISVAVGDFIDALSPGTYVAVVTANGQGGATSSQPSPPFTR